MAILGENRKLQFERSRYRISVDSAKFTNNGEVLVNYLVTGDDDDSHYAFKYRLGPKGPGAPLPVKK